VAVKLSKCSSKHRYVSVHIKFAVALGGALAWAGVAIWLAQRWLGELSALAGPVLAHLMIYGIAVIPGFMNCFLILSLLFDRRPEFLPENAGGQLPAITILQRGREHPADPGQHRAAGISWRAFGDRDQ
jgi:biofilm PGA synthesis N-glycosyltransferase PgaC